VKGKQGLDLVALIGAEALFDEIWRNADPIGNLESLHFNSMGAGCFAETSAEVAIDAADHSVAGGEGVDHARFPSAGARPWVYDDFSLGGLEDAFEALKDFLKYAGEFRSPMID
jgi:hypothetical protein